MLQVQRHWGRPLLLLAVCTAATAAGVACSCWKLRLAFHLLQLSDVFLRELMNHLALNEMLVPHRSHIKIKKPQKSVRRAGHRDRCLHHMDRRRFDRGREHAYVVLRVVRHEPEAGSVIAGKVNDIVELQRATANRSERLWEIVDSKRLGGRCHSLSTYAPHFSRVEIFFGDCKKQEKAQQVKETFFFRDKLCYFRLVLAIITQSLFFPTRRSSPQRSRAPAALPSAWR